MPTRSFGRMKESAYFVNASRGGLVDEAALEAALREGGNAGAALDVGRGADNLPSPRLVALANVVAVLHVGGYVPQVIAHHATETARQVEALLRGERPVGAINWEAATRLSNHMEGA